MRCREVRRWLYSFRPTASWPADVVTHLQDCQACGQLRTRLQRIDEGMSKLTGPASDGTPQARLLDRIAVTPQARGQESGVRNQESGGRGQESAAWPWLRYGGYVVGMAASVALAFLLGHWAGGESESKPPVEIVKTVEVVREKIVEVPAQPQKPNPDPELPPVRYVPVETAVDRQLFASLLKQSAQLVQKSKASDRLGCLLDMAEDCQKHALTMIAKGARDSLPATVDLYGKLVREGVLAEVAQAPVSQRPALQKLARGRLQEMSIPPLAPGEMPKAVKDQRAALQRATVQALNLIDDADNAVTKKPARRESASPSAALVQFAIAYCAAPGPIDRADLSADCVQRLMPSVMLSLAEGDEPQRVQMGQAFGLMIKHGIYAPLAVATAKEPPESVKDQVSRIYQSAAQTVADLEEHLKQADARTRPALQAALDATRMGPQKGVGKTK